MRMLTTGDCADILNAAFDSPGAFTSAFIWGQIRDGKLTPRVNVPLTVRRRIRIHPADFAAYLERYHAAIATRAKADPRLAA